MNEDKGCKKIENNKPAVDLSRRRLAKIGLLSAPVLATLPGKSVFARNDCTVSGNLSGNMSGDPADDVCAVTYTGRSIATLHSELSPPSLGTPGALVFKDVFCNGNACLGSVVGDKTFHEVMEAFLIPPTPTLELEAHFVAAYLNASDLHSLGEFPYSPADIVGIFSDYLNGSITEATLLSVFGLLNVN